MQSRVQPPPTTTDPWTLSSPITLIAPRNNQRNQLIAPFLSDSRNAYYALQDTDQNYNDLTANILNVLREQGAAIPVGRATVDDEKAGQVLGAALAQAGIEVLVLDEADRLSADPSEWVRGLVQTLPSSAHVVISARQLDATQWNPLIESGAAEVIGDINPTGSPTFDGQSGRLEVYALGIGEVWYEGRVVTRWDGPLTRRLFYFLLDRGPVSRMTIFETFWPSLPIREATNVFHVTKRKMNETIGDDVTDYSDRHYGVSDKVHLVYDVAAFEAATHEADIAITDDASMKAWERAIRVYRHPFLMQETTPWTMTRRNELRDQYAQALIGTARTHQRQGDIDMALAHYLRALREVPLREDLHNQVMKLYVERGNNPAAVAQYERMRQCLADALGIAPARESTQLYNKLTR